MALCAFYFVQNTNIRLPSALSPLNFNPFSMVPKLFRVHVTLIKNSVASVTSVAKKFGCGFVAKNLVVAWVVIITLYKKNKSW